MAMRIRNVAALFVISLAVAVISLSTDACAAVAPTITVRPTWVPVPGFGHLIGKMATDASGTIYVADHSQKAIIKLNGSGQYLGRISTAAIGSPYGVAVLKNGNIVATFQVPVSRAVMFDPAGTVISGGTDLGNARFQHATAVVVDGLDNIYVLDGGSLVGNQYYDGNYYIQLSGSYPSIHVFRKNGAKYLTTPYIGPRPAGYPDNSFGSISRLNPLNYSGDDKGFGILGAEGMLYDPVNKRILVADTTNGRVVAFSSAEAAQPFVQLSKPGSPTVPLQWGTSYIMAVSNDLVDGHMAAPVGLALEQAAGRLYVVDKTLARIKVFDYASGAMLKLIDPLQIPGLKMSLPRDILLYKGNLLVSSEEAQAKANLVTLGIDTAQWPPSAVQLLIDPFPPNITKQAGDIFRFTGKVETGASVSWANGSFTGSCVIPNPVGYGLENYYCDVLLDTTNGSSGTYQNITFTATKNGSSSNVAALPAPLYTTATSLRTAPVVVSTPPAKQFTNAPSATLSGTIDFSATGATAGAMVKLVNTHDGAVYYAIIDLQSSGNTKPWSADVILEEGVNTFVITGWAEMTETGTAANQTITLDTVNPDITFGFLQDGAVTTRQVLNVNGIVSETNLKSVSVAVNGYPLYESIPVDSANGYFSGVIELSRNGQNTVTVSAEDHAGNVSTVLRTVTLDPMKAQPINVTEPAADNVFFSSPLTQMPYACTADPTATSVRFGGTEVATLQSGVWSVTSNQFIPTAGILRTVTVEASGPSWTLHDVRSFYLDTAAPAAQISVPPVDVSVKTLTIPFSGTFDGTTANPVKQVTALTAELLDSTGTAFATVALTTSTTSGSSPGGLSVSFDTVTKTFSGTIDLNGKADGRYTLRVKVTASDVTTTVRRNILLDRSTPLVSICVDPANGSILYGAVESGAVLSFSEGTPISLTGNTWSTVRPAVGTFSVTATDPAGNQKTVGTPAVNPYDGDMDGDGIVRVYDAVIALRAVANNQVTDGQKARGDMSTLGYAVSGLSCPDGNLTMEDVQLILAKASGRAL